MDEMAFERGKQRRGSKGKPKSSASAAKATVKPGTATRIARKNERPRRLSAKDRRASTLGEGANVLKKPSMGGRKLSHAVIDKLKRDTDEHNTPGMGKASEFMTYNDAFDTNSGANSDQDSEGGIISPISPMSPNGKTSLDKLEKTERAPYSKAKSTSKTSVPPMKDATASSLRKVANRSMPGLSTFNSSERTATKLHKAGEKAEEVVLSRVQSSIALAEAVPTVVKSYDIKSGNEEARNVAKGAETLLKRRKSKVDKTDDAHCTLGATSLQTIPGMKDGRKSDPQGMLPAAPTKGVPKQEPTKDFAEDAKPTYSEISEANKDGKQAKSRHKEANRYRATEPDMSEELSSVEVTESTAESASAESLTSAARPASKKHTQKHKSKTTSGRKSGDPKPGDTEKSTPKKSKSKVVPPQAAKGSAHLIRKDKTKKETLPKADDFEYHSSDGTAYNPELSTESEELFQKVVEEVIEPAAKNDWPYDSEFVRRAVRTTETKRKYAGTKHWNHDTGGRAGTSTLMIKPADKPAIPFAEDPDELYLSEDHPRAGTKVGTGTFLSDGSCWPSHIAERRIPIREQIGYRPDEKPDEYWLDDDPLRPNCHFLDKFEDTRYPMEMHPGLSSVTPCYIAPRRHGSPATNIATECACIRNCQSYWPQLCPCIPAPAFPNPGTSQDSGCLCEDGFARNLHAHGSPKEPLNWNEFLRHEERNSQEERFRQHENALREEKIRQDERIREEQESARQENKLREQRVLHGEKRYQVGEFQKRNLPLEQTTEEETQRQLRLLQKQRLRLELLRERKQRLLEQIVQAQQCEERLLHQELLQERKFREKLLQENQPEELPWLVRQRYPLYLDRVERTQREKRQAEQRAQERVSQEVIKEGVRRHADKVHDQDFKDLFDHCPAGGKPPMPSHRAVSQERRWKDARRCTDAGASEEPRTPARPPPRRRQRRKDQQHP